MTNLLPPREMSITYAGYKVGGDQAARVLNGIYIADQDYEKGTIEFVFTVEQDTEANFAAECAAAEAAFRIPRQDMTLTQGAQTLRSWSQSGNTDMNAMPKIMKWGAKGDSGRARWYRIRIEAQLPADNLGLSGRQYSYVNVAYSPSRRRTVTISGTYTALSSNSARTQYQTVFDAYATSVLNALGGNYKKLEEPQSTADDANKKLDFSVTYEEIIYTAVAGTQVNLRGENLTISRAKTSPGDSPDGATTIDRLVTLNVNYEVWLDNTASKDLTGQWASLRASIISQAQTTLGGGSVIVVDEAPQFDYSNNHITATMTLLGATGLGVVEYTLSGEDFIVDGNVLVPVLDGKKFSKYPYQGPGTYTRTVTQSFLTFGKVPSFGSTFYSGQPPAGMQAKRQSFRDSYSPVQRGLPGGGTFTMRRISRTYIYEFYTLPASVAPAPVGTGDETPITSESSAYRAQAQAALQGLGNGAAGPNVPK